MPVFSIRSKPSCYRCAIWLFLTKLKDLRMRRERCGRTLIRGVNCTEGCWSLIQLILISCKWTTAPITILFICILMNTKDLNKFFMLWICKSNSLINNFTASCTRQDPIWKILFRFQNTQGPHLLLSQIKITLKDKITFKMMMVSSNLFNNLKIGIYLDLYRIKRLV